MTSRPDSDPQGPLWCVPGLGPVCSGDGAGDAAAWVSEPTEPAEPLEGVAAVVAHLARVAASITTMRAGLGRVGSADLARVMTVLGEASVALEAMTIEVTAEAVERGVPASTGQALSPVEWVRMTNLAYRGCGAPALVRAAELSRGRSFPELGEALRAGVVPVATAGAAVEQHTEVLSALPAFVAGAEDVRCAVAEAIVGAAATGSAREVRSMGRELIGRFGRDDVPERAAAAAYARRELSSPVETGSGSYDYRLRLDAPAMARLEAALDAVSKPCPDADGADPRTARQRRADGLLTLIDSAVAAPDGPGAGMRAALEVTMSLESLRVGLGGCQPAGAGFGDLRLGETVGQSGAAATAHLTPTQVRQLSCQAGLIPAVLDGDGVVVDQGRLTRLFPPALVRRLWVRDGGCTFPGCTMPAKWTQAHHLVHWSDGGTTSLRNAALLCARHHTVVHTRRLHGEVREDRVHWDLGHGSYRPPRRE